MSNPNETGIEWTRPPGFRGVTHNAVRGCSVVSPGCVNCYAMKEAYRHNGPGRPYEGLTKDGPKGPIWTGEVRTIPKKLRDPLTWTDPTCAFVGSMSDVFHDDVPQAFLAELIAVCAVAGARRWPPREDIDLRTLAPWTRRKQPPHLFLFLTKRAERMCRELNDPQFRVMVAAYAHRYLGGSAGGDDAAELLFGLGPKSMGPVDVVGTMWPPSNIGFGVSVESPKYLERLRYLSATPAAMRFASVEPLIEGLGEGLQPWLLPATLGAVCDCGHHEAAHWDRPAFADGPCAYCPCPGWTVTDPKADVPERDFGLLDWVIVGGESGPNARPFHLDWAREIVGQCAEAGVACFVKQLGANVSGRTLIHRKGGHPNEWPEDLRVREFPERWTRLAQHSIAGVAEPGGGQAFSSR